MFAKCKKEETTAHKDYTISGNVPPPYSGVPTILVENYVNKMYIDLIGLQPDDLARKAAVEYLEANNLKSESREKVIGDVIALDEFKDRLFQINSDLLLNGMGYDEVKGVYDEYSFVRDFVYQNGDTFQGQFFDRELEKLQHLLDGPSEYKSGAITLNEYFNRFSFNLIYDEINMGSENFVKSCFENFFKRNPTESELENGVRMVDGQPSQILMKTGSNKLDFLKIVVADSEFYQGRVLDAFRTLLLRDPLSNELSEYTALFKTSNEYNILLINLVKTDEYAGF